MQAEIIKFIQTIDSQVLNVLAQLITMFGEQYLIVAMAAFVFLSVDKDKGYRIIFAVASGACFNSLIKNIFRMPRPIGVEGIRSYRLETATSYSFPSGHSQSSSTFWTSAALAFKNKYIYTAGIIIVILVCLSRLYLGVHWPADVLFGALSGVVWAVASASVFDYIHKNKKYSLLICLSALFIICTLIFGDGDFHKTSGLLAGLSCGYIIETRYINLSINVKFAKKFIYYIIIIGGLLAVKGILKIILPGFPAFEVFRYFIAGLWALGIGPWLCAKISK